MNRSLKALVAVTCLFIIIVGSFWSWQTWQSQRRADEDRRLAKDDALRQGCGALLEDLSRGGDTHSLGEALLCNESGFLSLADLSSHNLEQVRKKIEDYHDEFGNFHTE